MLMLLMSWLDIILPLLLIFHWRRQLSPRWINPQVKGPSRAGWFVTGWDTSPYIYATDSDTCSHCEPRFPWLSKFVLTWNEGIGLCRSAEYKHHPRQEVVRGSLLCYWHWHQTPLLRLRYIFKRRCHKKEQVHSISWHSDWRGKIYQVELFFDNLMKFE